MVEPFVFLDDERNPDDVNWLGHHYFKMVCNYNFEEMYVVRNSVEFIQLIDFLLNKKELPFAMSFDHDLQDMRNIEKLKENIALVQDKKAGLSGKDVALMRELNNELHILNFYLNKGIKTGDSVEVTGKVLLEYFVDQLLNKIEAKEIESNEIKNIKMFFHSQNPVGKKVMENYWYNFLENI